MFSQKNSRAKIPGQSLKIVGLVVGTKGYLGLQNAAYSCTGKL
jgi:hypothetical protein